MAAPSRSWRSARQAARLLLQALPFMFILYLLFPRVSGPLWGVPQEARARRSGLSNEMAPGSISHLILSGAIAFRSRFADELPEKSELYWRGPVFDSYDGADLANARRRRPGYRSQAADDRDQRHGTPIPAFSKRTTSAGCWHSMSHQPAGGECAGADPRSRWRASRCAPAPAYAFASSVDYHANRVEAPAILQQALTLPARINPRTRALADSWKSRPRRKSPRPAH
jgi:hypothetical protein